MRTEYSSEQSDAVTGDGTLSIATSAGCVLEAFWNIYSAEKYPDVTEVALSCACLGQRVVTMSIEDLASGQRPNECTGERMDAAGKRIVSQADRH